MDSVLFDYSRKERIGLPEAVFCDGKPYAVLVELLKRFAHEKKNPILFTRLSPEIFSSLPDAIKVCYSYDEISRTAYVETLPLKKTPSIAIVSAGTADSFVSHEAARTLEYLGYPYLMFEDCGVAGLWRLAGKLEAINECDCVIVVAGLDAALASVLGGLTPKPIFAVPTSIGYGMADNGRTALASMLVSCAQGIAVLNIDNGYGAACAAVRVINTAQRLT
ncbi:MAG: nickel pincer cofactor biosynthesis protein LarB [Desulfovibrionaceae bacterium]|nr:nickel pincer cofactor biosynthesis protein LarB [Desulfovibrionaceae bacterium]